jgi:hypothetical protein
MKDREGPPWLYLLEPMDLGWREKEIGKGRDPDPYIEKKLREAGVWPPKRYMVTTSAVHSVPCDAFFNTISNPLMPAREALQAVEKALANAWGVEIFDAVRGGVISFAQLREDADAQDY